MKDQISVLVPTCDKYSDCWEGLGLSWDILSELDLDIFVISDSINFNYEGNNFIPLNINKPDYTKNDFSNKIIYGLEQIKTKYVLIMCDDMWPDRSLKNILPSFLEFMENENADCLRIHEKLHWWEYYFESTEKFINDERVLKMKQDSPYLLTHNAAIWNVDYLKSIQFPDEDPWQNETLGTERAKFKKNNQYHFNIRWYIQFYNFHRGVILDHGRLFIDDLKYKKQFNEEFNIKRK